MNKTFIIGNLTRDPELRTVQGQDGPVSVCDFTVAVNRRNGRTNANGQPEVDFFKVTAWRQLGENCAKYLAKGRKVSVMGPVSASAYIGNDGVTRASLEIKADEVEFLTPRQEGQQGGAPAYQNAKPAYQNASPAYQNAPAQQQYPQQWGDKQNGFVQVDEEELPF